MERRSLDGSFHRFIFVSALENHIRNKIIYGLSLITICDHSWGDSPIIFTQDCVTHEIFGGSPHLWPQTSLLTTAHTLFYISRRFHGGITHTNKTKCWFSPWVPGALLRTWLNFNPSMDKSSYVQESVGWNHLSISKLQMCSCWSLGMH